MSLSITTLNNEAAVAKTFTLISADGKQSEWQNTTDSTSTFDSRITVKQVILGKTLNGIPIRRCLVQAMCSAPLTALVNGISQSIPERVVQNYTITTPTSLGTLTATNQADHLAFLRNFLTAANQVKLVRGELA